MADTTRWHHATIDREGDDRLFAAEFLVHQLAKLVDQATWDAAVTLTLGTLTGLHEHSADVIAGSYTVADHAAVARYVTEVPIPYIPTQRDGGER